MGLNEFETFTIVCGVFLLVFALIFLVCLSTYAPACNPSPNNEVSSDGAMICNNVEFSTGLVFFTLFLIVLIYYITTVSLNFTSTDHCDFKLNPLGAKKIIKKT